MTRYKPQYYKPSKNKAHRLTVGALRHDIATLPDDTPVFYEVIEDWYFDKGINGLNLHNGWLQPHSSIFIPDGISAPPDIMHHFVRAYCAMNTKVFKDGRKGLVITAHY